MKTPEVTAVTASRRRKGWRRVIADTGLPTSLAELVVRVTRRTRLWRSEQADVAQELCAHFADGLAAGRTEAQLIESFGEPGSASRLIRRAKRRARPGWWQALLWTRRVVAWSMALCLAAYLFLFARYVLGRPTISRNYLAELNAPVLATPKDDRAWPVYLQAMRAWGAEPTFMREGEFEWPMHPGDKYWEQMVGVMRERKESLALVRRGAAMPVLGFIARGSIDPEYQAAMAVRNPEYKPDPEPEVENPMLVGVLLPHLGEMRRFAKLLASDAAEAAAAGDRARFVSDVEAMLGMADQALGERLIICNLVGLAIADLGVETLLTEGFQSGLLGADELTRLAHRLSAVGGSGGLRIDFSGDRMMLADFLQRLYSDDGHGDGHPVYGGLSDEYRNFGVMAPSKFMQQAAYPVLTARSPSRAELHRIMDRTIDQAEADQELPMWRRAERRADDEYRRIIAVTGRMFPVIESLTNGQQILAQSILSRDKLEMRIEAAEAVLAMHAYKLKTGAFPKSLTELVPDYLPRVPVDGADGRPMRYRVTEGGPVLYSIGCDEDDDGGRMPAKENREAARFSPRGEEETNRAVQAEIDGDWVFFPPPPPPTRPVK